MPDRFNVLDVTQPGTLPAGSNNIGYVGSVPGQKVGLGRFFLAGTGQLTLSAAGHLRATVENPAGSGKTISVARFVAYTQIAGFAHLFLNPTVGLPTAAARPLNNAVFGGGVPGVAVLRADTDLTVALSGGTSTGISVGLPAGRTSIDLPPLVLTSGVTLGVNAPFAGSDEVSLDLYWWED